MTIDNHNSELNMKYIYLVLHTLKSFNYKFDTISFYGYDTHTVLSNNKTYNDLNYIIKEMPYSKARSILMNQNLSYIKEKVHYYMINIDKNNNLSHTYAEKSL
ncbi:hypothetical protein [uncultured Clostridium sp.]|uniref:hypothetical protein n=1 Tax=uncultured Clostridium sp. TaxID=59620 RepID=UPI0028E59BF9|nr:hypothetical protein [uncultured Clostridium sp.]